MLCFPNLCQFSIKENCCNTLFSLRTTHSVHSLILTLQIIMYNYCSVRCTISLPFLRQLYCNPSPLMSETRNPPFVLHKDCIFDIFSFHLLNVKTKRQQFILIHLDLSIKQPSLYPPSPNTYTLS